MNTKCQKIYRATMPIVWDTCARMEAKYYDGSCDTAAGLLNTATIPQRKQKNCLAKCPHVSFARTTWLGYGQENRGIVVRFPEGGNDFAVPQSVRTHYGTHPASYSVSTGGKAAGK